MKLCLKPKGQYVYKKNGFTLVELLVVLAIIGILSLLSFEAIKKSQATVALDRATHKVAQDIRRAAQMSQGGQSWPDCSPGQIIGYGLRFDSSIGQCYFIYAECDNLTTYDSTETCAAPGLGADKIVEKIPFERGITIQAYSWTSGLPTNSRKNASILFIPPKPTMSVEGSTSPLARVEIILKLRNAPDRKILINQKGTVEIK